MILLDPDLDPNPAPKATLAKRLIASRPPTQLKNLRLPSARTLAGFLGEAQAAVRLKGEVTVLLINDAAIRKLNRRYRGKNESTDVLSFPVDASITGPEKMAGDLAISVPAARRQAAEQGHALSTEIKVLILHGLLHLAGYDHEIDTGRMARRERLLRGRLGLPLGLIERTGYPTLSPERRRKNGARGIEVSHPSRKSKDAARVGHPRSRQASTTAGGRP
jgi:probable rRNA maturation factor